MKLLTDPHPDCSAEPHLKNADHLGSGGHLALVLKVRPLGKSVRAQLNGAPAVSRTLALAVASIPLRASCGLPLLLLLPPPVKAVVFANCRDRSAGSERWQLGDRATRWSDWKAARSLVRRSCAPSKSECDGGGAA